MARHASQPDVLEGGDQPLGLTHGRLSGGRYRIGSAHVVAEGKPSALLDICDGDAPLVDLDRRGVIGLFHADPRLIEKGELFDDEADRLEAAIAFPHDDLQEGGRDLDVVGIAVDRVGEDRSLEDADRLSGVTDGDKRIVELVFGREQGETVGFGLAPPAAGDKPAHLGAVAPGHGNKILKQLAGRHEPSPKSPGTG